MEAHGGGTIVNNSSDWGLVGATAALAYATSKVGCHFSKWGALECRQISCVAAHSVFFFYRFVFAQGALLQLTRCLALDHASAVSSVAFEPAHTILDA